MRTTSLLMVYALTAYLTQPFGNLSIVQERHRAINRLIGWESVYSQVTTDT